MKTAEVFCKSYAIEKKFVAFAVSRDMTNDLVFLQIRSFPQPQTEKGGAQRTSTSERSSQIAS